MTPLDVAAMITSTMNATIYSNLLPAPTCRPI